MLRWVNGVVSRAFNWDLRSVDFGSALREFQTISLWLIRWFALVSTDLIGLWYVNSLDSTLFLRKPGNVNLNLFSLSSGTSLLVRVIMHKWVRGRLNSTPRRTWVKDLKIVIGDLMSSPPLCTNVHKTWEDSCLR